jgi:hypothetical protein
MDLTPSRLAVPCAELDSALAIRTTIAETGFDIYAPLLSEHPELVYWPRQLEELLARELVLHTYPGANKTRSKLIKEAVCRALGYPTPRAFKKGRPHFLGQDLDVCSQKNNNLQVYNEPLSPTRRYAVVGITPDAHAHALRVIEGTELMRLDTTGTLTRKYQAKRRPGCVGDRLVSARDTQSFIAELSPTDKLAASVLRRLPPASPPLCGKVLTVQALYRRLLGLIGHELAYDGSERRRGDALHSLACKVLGLGSYADTGRFPDIVCQALEVKLQTAATIDLGLVAPDSEEPAITLSPRLRHCDSRYLVAYAKRDGDVARIEHIVVSSGEDFFSEFRRFKDGGMDSKLQLHIPKDFFLEAE